jgi:hypothetical protein
MLPLPFFDNGNVGKARQAGDSSIFATAKRGLEKYLPRPPEHPFMRSQLDRRRSLANTQRARLLNAKPAA